MIKKEPYAIYGHFEELSMKQMYEKLKENLQNHECAPAEKKLMEEALEAISILESTVFATLDVLKEAKNQRDKAFEALIKTTKLQHEVEEKLEKAIRAIKTMRDGSDAVMLHTAREILEELEGYKE